MGHKMRSVLAILMLSIPCAAVADGDGYTIVPQRVIRLPPEPPSKPPARMCWVTIEQGYREFVPGYYYWGPWHWEDGFQVRYEYWEPAHSVWVRTGIVRRKQPCSRQPIRIQDETVEDQSNGVVNFDDHPVESRSRGRVPVCR